MNLDRIITTRPYNELDITFWPTDICNFNCSYCFPGIKDGVYRYPKDLDIVINKFTNLFAQYASHNKTHYNLSIAGGGEPTLWPHLEEFCERVINLANVKIELVTNGSRTIDWWSKNAKYINKAILSCHVQDVDIEHFVKVADTLHSNGTEVLAMMLMDAQNWNQCIEYVDYMQNSNHTWTIIAKEVVSAPGSDISSYSQEQLEYVRDPIKRFAFKSKDISEYRTVESIGFYGDKTFPAFNNTYIVNNQNYFKDWKCNVPLERISIDAGLNVKGSCGLTFDKIESITCTKNCCDCQSDTHITKWKP